MKKIITFKKGEPATMDDLDKLLQVLPTATRDTGNDSPIDKEEYFTQDVKITVEVKQ